MFAGNLWRKILWPQLCCQQLLHPPEELRGLRISKLFIMTELLKVALLWIHSCSESTVVCCLGRHRVWHPMAISGDRHDNIIKSRFLCVESSGGEMCYWEHCGHCIHWEHWGHCIHWDMLLLGALHSLHSLETLGSLHSLGTLGLLLSLGSLHSLETLKSLHSRCFHWQDHFFLGNTESLLSFTAITASLRTLRSPLLLT